MNVFSERVLRDLVSVKSADGSLGAKRVQIALASGILEIGMYLDEQSHSVPPAFSKEFEDIKVGGTD